MPHVSRNHVFWNIVQIITIELAGEDCLVFQGAIMHSLVKDKITCSLNTTVVVKSGKIVLVKQHASLVDVRNALRDDTTITPTTIKLSKSQFLCPGFIDLHTHASQFPNLGLGMDKPLLEWLEAYTFPLEKKYGDGKFAEKAYKYMVENALNCGTTTACYYATIHTDSSLILARTAAELGQRALIGKVNMNRNSPEDYVENIDESIKETERMIREISKMGNSLIEPVITPRFAISCEMELLQKLGKIAEERQLHIQTHISENREEVEFTSILFPECNTYAEIYDRAGLLTNKTILAHAVHLTDEELSLLSKRKASVAHCPCSNTLLRSGQCDVKTLWSHGLTVGLGTDVSGGCDCSILGAMRSALDTSLHISFHRPDYTPLTFHEVFYMATLGGATALRKDDLLGNFLVGKDFDALLVDMEYGKSKAGTFETEHNSFDLFQKLIFSGDDRNIKQVYVQGKLVKNAL